MLTFNIPPDYESPDDDATDATMTTFTTSWWWLPTTRLALDDTDGNGMIDGDEVASNKAYKKVTIMVTDVPEPGMVTLSSRQPQVGAALTATLTDPEVETLTPTWKWEKSQDMSSWTPIDSVSEAARTPDATTVGYYLRATATYEDDNNNDRTAQAVSVNKVRAAPTTADANSAFPTEDDANDRTVAENSPAGTNVGAPVKATDTADDVLTYSLLTEDDANLGGFQINPATGQITVGPRTNMNHDDDGTDLHRHGDGH